MYNGVASAVYNAPYPYGAKYANRPTGGGGHTPGGAANDPYFVEVAFNTFWLSINDVIDSYDLSSRFRNAVSYSLTGTWPAGLSVSGSNLVGTPTEAGTFSSCTVTATNTNGTQVSNTFTVDVCAEEAKMYFDAVSGDDANDGSTSLLAKQTIPELRTQVIAASARNRFVLNRGDSWDVSLDLNNLGSGSLGNHVVIGSYGTGAKPIIAPASGSAITMQSHSSNATSYFSVMGLDLRGVGAGTEGFYMYQGGAATNNLDHITLMACDLTAADNGIQIANADNNPALITNIILDGNSIHDCTDHGAITGSITTYSFSNNTLANNGGNASLEWGLYATKLVGGMVGANRLVNTTGGTQGFKFRSPNNVSVLYNYIDVNENGNVCLNFGPDDVDENSTGGIVKGNVLLNPIYYGLYLANSDAEATNAYYGTAEISYNTAYGSLNTCQPLTWEGRWVNTNLYNNTFSTAGTNRAANFEGQGSHVGCTCKNNIFRRTNVGSTSSLLYMVTDAAIDTVFDYNIYQDDSSDNVIRVISTEYNLADWITLYGGNANSVEGTANLTSATDFTLTVSSTNAIDQGVVISGSPTSDIGGYDTPVNTTPDIGAYEYQV